LLIAPAIFSLKMSMSFTPLLSPDKHWNHYWNRIIYWPFRLSVLSLVLFILWKKYYRGPSFFGLTVRNFEWKPYAAMLLVMVPLIAAASTQPDFLQVYPKLSMVEADVNHLPNSWLYKLLFELSYGSDFISIELFFRGFLVLAFVKWAGADAVLPMACFYCSIHFGKPLGECISSYAGGLLLGIVVYRTRSIAGGLLVHLGIAWLMEVGGYIGNGLAGQFF
jgi:membrane protease YdiL (CAAX protease family)